MPKRWWLVNYTIKIICQVYDEEGKKCFYICYEEEMKDKEKERKIDRERERERMVGLDVISALAV